MNIDINTPEIKILLRQVELKASVSPRIVSDFCNLADKISGAGDRLSQSTLERLWQYSTRRKDTVSKHTLDVLARYVGYADWEGFRQTFHHNAHPESGYYTDGLLDVETLAFGCKLCLTWLPDRKIEVIYLGPAGFKWQKASIPACAQATHLNAPRSRQNILFISTGSVALSRVIMAQTVVMW